MARRKKPENETEQQQTKRQELELITNHATRSEKMSWNRQMDNLVKIMAQIKPIQDKILELEAKKQPLIDELADLRKKMVRECVHPFEQLVHKDDHIECKFCMKKFALTKWYREN